MNHRIMKNFKKITDISKINKKPTTIAIKTVKNKGTLQMALSSYNMEGSQLNELAILNGMELTDQVEAGYLIKTLGLLGGGAALPTNIGGTNTNNSNTTTNTNNGTSGSTNNSGGIKNNKTGTSGTKTTKSGGTKIGGKGNLKKKKKD